VEEAVGISIEVEPYDWITFLSMADGSEAYNRYFGRLSGGEIMGVMARKVDTPEYIKRIQMDLFDILSRAKDSEGLHGTKPEAEALFERYGAKLRDADHRGLIIRRRVGRTKYEKKSLVASAVEAVRRRNVSRSQGRKIGYIVEDAGFWKANAEGNVEEYNS
jgi:DNA polymerase I